MTKRTHTLRRGRPANGSEPRLKLPGLYAERTLRDMTQAELARRIGVRAQVVSSWERGRSAPREYARRIARALRCTMGELVR